ncbi:MAG TPA: DUF2905 domain-containing protein [Balneolaceae bacterium]|nr:DUF2905 domain-containing protein [Balneolaceae bacterium]
MNEQLGKWLVGIGAFIVLAGIIVWLFGDKLSWLGHLPGDIRIKGDHYGFYFPITTMIIISIVLSILLTLIARFLGK